MPDYIISVDQSTQGTKALLFDACGGLLARVDKSHRQIISDEGWISHDLDEIYENTIEAVRTVIEKNGIAKTDIKAIGISNQRETTAVWERNSGRALARSIVWQCSRGKDICARLLAEGAGELVKERTGIPLSAYFPAVKAAWFLENVPGLKAAADAGHVCIGTMDSFLVYRLTKGASFKTDYSNASRTQLFDIDRLAWDEDICRIMGVPVSALPEVCDSDSLFGMTTLEGYFQIPVPIHGVMGDSHAALFGQGCHVAGSLKTTYGTGSSIMMNTGEKAIRSGAGLVTSLAWKINGQVNYVLEGNINYTGAVISWLKDKAGLISKAAECEALARAANQDDTTYFVPAFTGLGAPYWCSDAKAVIAGMTSLTGKNELVKAALESIAYQIADVVLAMERDYGSQIGAVRVDGGPTGNGYLMQFQSDLLRKPVEIPVAEELSGIGAAYLAGIASGVYNQNQLFNEQNRTRIEPDMDEAVRSAKYGGWKEAVARTIAEYK